MNASIISLTPSELHFDWGTDGLVLWIEELDGADSLVGQMNEVLERIAFAIELQTGWDHRTDGATLHPLYGYRLLLRDASGRWNALRLNETGQFIELIPLEEMDYEVAYDKVMWLD
ncbi:hypothetical protein HNV11_01610 [Spirosoma taeanense]|uniref:Uncharacterized protein n=1 Tax=Spirosoma taeanense TaxID=2735870 RepID=A0A6M5Y050_9BACT|nr:hypothetical protein [Spirosoma taeanense]QJW88167.1 hypothetical protein HNV11_01610 [Spirosoma taeanense]